MRGLFAIMAGTVLVGCATTYPMNLSKEEWEALPVERKAELRAEQYRLNAERQAQAEAVRAQRAEAAAAAQREQQARVSAAYANARYGDIVSVTMRGGLLRYANTGYPCEATSFDLVRGERKEIELRGYLSQHGVRKALVSRIWVRLSDDGNALYLNDDTNVQPIVLVNDGSWEAGRAYPLAGQGVRNIVDVDIANMIVTIRLREVSGAPQRIIIEQR